jgi:hypothetical protein
VPIDLEHYVEGLRKAGLAAWRFRLSRDRGYCRHPGVSLSFGTMWGLGNFVTVGSSARPPGYLPAIKAPVLGNGWRSRMALALLVVYAVASYVRFRVATRQIR